MFYYSWPSFKEVKDYGKRTVSGGGFIVHMCVFSLVLRYYLFIYTLHYPNDTQLMFTSTLNQTRKPI